MPTPGCASCTSLYNSMGCSWFVPVLSCQMESNVYEHAQYGWTTKEVPWCFWPLYNATNRFPSFASSKSCNLKPQYALSWAKLVSFGETISSQVAVCKSSAVFQPKTISIFLPAKKWISSFQNKLQGSEGIQSVSTN